LRNYLVYLAAAFLPLFFLVFGWEVTLVAAVFGLMFFRLGLTPENDRWYGLRDVQTEYNLLLASVQIRKRTFYAKQLESALHPLFAQRDRAFKAQAILGAESLEEIEFKIEQIRMKSQNLTDPAMIEMFRGQLKDLNENKKKLEQLQGFLAKFEVSRTCVAESIQLLRNRILLTETGDDKTDEGPILEDLKSLHAIYEKVNRPPAEMSTVASEQAVTDAPDSEAVPLPPERLSE
jgi:hypothetical protein